MAFERPSKDGRQVDAGPHDDPGWAPRPRNGESQVGCPCWSPSSTRGTFAWCLLITGSTVCPAEGSEPGDCLIAGEEIEVVAGRVLGALGGDEVSGAVRPGTVEQRDEVCRRSTFECPVDDVSVVPWCRQPEHWRLFHHASGSGGGNPALKVLDRVFKGVGDVYDGRQVQRNLEEGGAE